METLQLRISQAVLLIITTLAKLKGVTFAGIKLYTNASNEVANVVVNLGVDYYKAKLADIETLKNFDIEEFYAKLEKAKVTLKSTKIDILTAVTELLNEYQKPNQNRVDGQKEAYVHITNGVKVHKQTGKVFIYAFTVSKKVIVEGVYKEVKSKPVTIAKNELKKHLLRTGKFRQYIVEDIGAIKVSGETILVNLFD